MLNVPLIFLYLLYQLSLFNLFFTPLSASCLLIQSLLGSGYISSWSSFGTSLLHLKNDSHFLWLLKSGDWMMLNWSTILSRWVLISTAVKFRIAQFVYVNCQQFAKIPKCIEMMLGDSNCKIYVYSFRHSSSFFNWSGLKF